MRKYLLLVSISLVIILLILIWLYPSNDDFQSENPFWNGIKDISLMTHASPVSIVSDLPLSSIGSTLILIPYVDFSNDELEKLRNFIVQGGTLVLADDYGFGNQILEYLGIKARFSGQILLDPLFNYKNEWLPMIFKLTPNSITSGIESIVFNHATCLTGVETDKVIAFSSSFSFLDLNENQERDEDEPNGPLPVVSRDSLGDGKLIIISDPSIFINSMREAEDNNDFIQNIVATATSKLLIDQSHLPPSNLSSTKIVLANVRNLVGTPAGTMGLVILALTVTMIPILRGRELSEAGEQEEV